MSTCATNGLPKERFRWENEKRRKSKSKYQSHSSNAKYNDDELISNDNFKLQDDVDNAPLANPKHTTSVETDASIDNKHNLDNVNSEGIKKLSQYDTLNVPNNCSLVSVSDQSSRGRFSSKLRLKKSKR